MFRTMCCRDELRSEWKIRKAAVHRIARCSSGPLPTIIEDDRDDSPALPQPEDIGEDPEFEEGDRMFAAGLHHSSTEIQTTSTISQRLAEAFKRNSEPLASDDRPGLPDYLRKFEDVGYG